MVEKLWDKDSEAGRQSKQIEAFTVGNDHLIDRLILAEYHQFEIAG